MRIENEVSRARDVSQWKLIRDRGQISQEILYLCMYYKKGFMSNEKSSILLYIYISHCGSEGWDVLMEKEG